MFVAAAAIVGVEERAIICKNDFISFHFHDVVWREICGNLNKQKKEQQ